MADFDLDSACKLFQRFTGAKPFGTVRIDGQIVARLFKVKSREYCVRIAREFYKHFGYHFPDQPHKGYGQTVNLTLLRRLESLDIDNLVTIMDFPDGIVAYASSVKQILEFYKTYATDIPHLDGEIGFPVTYLKRFFPQLGLKASAHSDSFLISKISTDISIASSHQPLLKGVVQL